MIVATDGPALAGFRAGLVVPVVAAALGVVLLATARRRPRVAPKVTVGV